MEPLLERGQVLTGMGFRKATRVDRLQHASVDVEAATQPVRDRPFASLKDDVQQGRQHDQRRDRGDARRGDQMIECRVQQDCEREARREGD